VTTICDLAAACALKQNPPFSVLRAWRRILILLLSVATLSCAFSPGISARPPAPAAATSPNDSPALARDREKSCRIVYVGFVGALEPAGHKDSGIVQIRDTLLGPAYPDVCAKSFVPFASASALDWIMLHFPAHDGPLTSAEISASPKVILVGHSMGGWAALGVARELRSKAIPVELTVQVDSVGITDITVPKNVRLEAIFHAHDVLMFMTTKNIKFEDALHSKLVANVLVKNASHLSITRDPRIRELVLSTVKELRLASMAPTASTAAISPVAIAPAAATN
jgi:hypothetical protein